MTLRSLSGICLAVPFSGVNLQNQYHPRTVLKSSPYVLSGPAVRELKQAWRKDFALKKPTTIGQTTIDSAEQAFLI